MNIKNLQKNWDRFGEKDPMWAILTEPEKKGNKWTEEAFFERGKLEIQHLLRMIERRNIPLNFGKALDFGCGIGRLSQALAKRFEEVHGVDIAPSMIEKAKALNAFDAKCHYHVNGINDLSLFQSDYFDLVYSNITLQHIHPNLSLNYIKEFLRVVKSDGLVVFQMPSEPAQSLRWVYKWLPSFLLNGLRRLKYDKDAVMEMYYIEKTKIINFLEQNGAEVVHIFQDKMPEGGMISYKYFVKKH